MEFKKSIIILIMAIFLINIAGVCASDANDTMVAGEDANQMGVSSNIEITEDNLKMSEENTTLTQTNEDETLTAGEGNYTDLRNDINNGGSLTKSYYRYCDGDGGTIEIATPMTINGNGAIIDMAGSAIQAFNVTASDVTIKNLTIKNANCSGDGPAIYFNGSGTVENCNFINNSAPDGDGGAVYFKGSGNLTGCNFEHNSARLKGGAVYFESASTVANCNFTANIATYSRGNGGAVYFNGRGNVTDCNFIDNKVTGTSSWGGAVRMDYGNVADCNFTGNSAAYGGGAVYFTSTKYPGFIENCNFTGNAAGFKGGAVYSASRNSTSISTVANCSFADNKASDVNGYGGAALMYYGLVENCNFTGNAAGFKGGALSFESASTVANCNFEANFATYSKSKGGAIYFYNPGNVVSCNFTDNSIPYQGGAIYFEAKGNVINSNFNGNNATSGSAIYFWATSAAKAVSDSTFLNNRADAEALEVTKNENNITIIFTGQDNLLNAIFSRGDVSFSNVTYWAANGINNTDGCTPIRSNRQAGQNITVAIIVNGIVLNEVKVTDADGTIVLDDVIGTGSYTIAARHDADSYYTEAERIITNTQHYVNVMSMTTTNRTVNITAKSDIYGEVMPDNLLFILPDGTEINANYAAGGIWWAVHTFDDYGDYEINATYAGLANLTIINATISITRANSTVDVGDVVLDYGDSKNLTIKTEGATEITAMINDRPIAVVDNFTIPISGLDAGTYFLTVTTIADADHNNVTKKCMIIVNKIKTELTADSINTTYNANDDLVITLKDSKGTPLINQLLFVDLNGVKMFMTDSNGQVKVSTRGLDANTYAARIIFRGGDNYKESNSEATVTVNKASTVLTAGAVVTTYNINKNLVVTLKDGHCNPLAGVGITVNLNGAKTYSTDKNGQVKIATGSLVPKTYAAKITFNGNANYIKSTKEVKVTVKKATPKIAAKSKKFKAKTKTKKYTIALKNNVGKAIKNAKVSIKIKKKTYTTKTNAKGKATFKIKKLTKKGKYTAVIKYNGNKYYNKATKKVKIAIK